MDNPSKTLINLNSLVNLSLQLNETNDIKAILNASLLSLMGKLKISKGIVLVKTNENESYEIAVQKGKVLFDDISSININDLCDLETKEIKEQYLLSSGFKSCIPIKYQQEFLAIICLGKSILPSDYKEEEFQYISLVATITGIALKNVESIQLLTEENIQIARRNQLLTTFFEISRDFTLFHSKERIIQLLSHNLMGQLMVSKFAVFYINKESSISEIEKIKNTFNNSFDNIDFNEFLNLQDIVYIDEAEISDKNKKELIISGVKIISPMLMHNQTKGFLLIGSKQNNKIFNDDDKLFIKIIGNTAILSLENERLIRKEIEKQKLENELSLALDIQKKLLPNSNPKIQNFNISGISLPSRFVGGDYFDYIKLPNDNLLIAIADVSGKGMPAALLMANVQAALRALAPLELKLDILVSRINNIVYHNTNADKFVTFFCGELDIKNNIFYYVNAGHNPPILVRNETIKELKTGGIILGIFDDDNMYSIGKIQLAKDDLLVLYTDGVTESTNDDLEEFGADRLQNLLIKNKDFNSQKIIDNIISGINEFSKKSYYYDDITIVAIKS